MNESQIEQSLNDQGYYTTTNSQGEPVLVIQKCRSFGWSESIRFSATPSAPPFPVRVRARWRPSYSSSQPTKRALGPEETLAQRMLAVHTSRNQTRAGHRKLCTKIKKLRRLARDLIRSPRPEPMYDDAYYQVGA
jgi:hypothetical protein